MITAWLVLPLLWGLVAVGFGLLVERAAGRPMSWAVLLLAGSVAYLAWTDLATVPAFAAPVRWATVPIAVVGLVWGALRRRVGRRDAHEGWAVVGGALAFGAAALPFVLSGHPAFGGYASLGDGSFQMIGADLLPHLGASADALPRSTVRRVMDQYFASGYPSGAPLALGVLDWVLGASAMATFQTLVAMTLGLGGVAVGVLARRARVATGPTVALVAAVGAGAPLLQGYGLQGSIKEVGGVVLLVTLAALVAWTWPHLRGGSLRSGIPVGIAVVAMVAVMGPGAAPYLAAFAAIVILGLGLRMVRREFPPRALLPLAGVVVTAAVLGLPEWIAALRVSEVAESVLSNPIELGNLPRPLPVWKAFGGWVIADYRFPVVTPVATTFSVASVVVVGLLGVAGVARAVSRRSGLWLAWLAATGLATVYVTAVGSPWADGKALAIASPAAFATAGVGVAALAARRRVAAGVGVLLVAVVVVTGAFQYRGASLSPATRLGELDRLAQRVGTHAPVLLSEYDEYAKVIFDRGRPLSLGESQFAAWRVRFYGSLASPTAFNPSVDRLTPGDLTPFRWIVVRRGPVQGWPPPEFRLARTTRHYWLFRRVDDRVPRRWAPEERHGLATAPVRCSLRGRFEPGGVALLRPWSHSWTVQHPPSAWRARPDAPYLLDTLGAGVANVRVHVPGDGRYRIWVEGSFGRRLSVAVDGRPVATVAPGSTNYLVEPEPVGGESGTPMAGGTHTITLALPHNPLRPGAGAAANAIGRVWLADAAGRPHEVPVRDLPCRHGRTPRVDWLASGSRVRPDAR